VNKRVILLSPYLQILSLRMVVNQDISYFYGKTS
jgi:hypothetical protein